jgi:hypothetical protein
VTTTSWRRTLWDTDPLSWFTTANLPLAAVGLTLVYGITVLGPLGQAGSRPVVQVVALGMVMLSILWVHAATRPRRGTFTLGRAIVAVALASAAFVLSALGYAGESFALEQWWAPMSLSLVLFAMVPYVSAVRLAMLGAGLLTVVVATTLIFVVRDETNWPPLSSVVIALFPATFGVVGGVVMIRFITLALSRWSERPLELPNDDPRGDGGSNDGLVSAVDHATSSRIAPATALVASVLDRGVVTAADAALAGALATRLRDELMGEVDRTWIERIAGVGTLMVNDPDRLADHLDLAQRTAVRALLDVLLGPDAPQFGSARVELRYADSGAIAVTLRILSTVREGRGEAFLDPYYVSLQSTVSKLRWRTGPVTAVEFEVAATSPRRAAVSRTLEPGVPGGPTALSA